MTAHKARIGGRFLAIERGLLAVAPETTDELDPMPEIVDPETLAFRICHQLNIPADEHVETLTALLRRELGIRHEQAVAATKAACLGIAEDEAERCRRAGAYPAEQIAMTIAVRIRLRHIG
jgi:hypothetical protein